MIKVIGTVVIDIIGDGRTETVKFNVRSMRAPLPMVEGSLPTGLGEVKLTGGSGGVHGVLDKDGMVALTFDIPPSSAKVSIDFLYGGSYK